MAYTILVPSGSYAYLKKSNAGPEHGAALEDVSSSVGVEGAAGYRINQRDTRAVRAGMLAVIMPRHCSARSRIETGVTFQERSIWRRRCGRWFNLSMAVAHALSLSS